MIGRTGFILSLIFGVVLISLEYKYIQHTSAKIHVDVNRFTQWNIQLTNEVRNVAQNSETTMNEHLLNCSEFVQLNSRRIAVDLTLPSWDSLVLLTKHLMPGGRFKPNKCSNPDRVAIIVPYRNRTEQLKVFLRHMHPFLQRQQIQYGVYIIEQDTGVSFNRGMLMNIGFAEAAKRENYQCYVFHDVDLLPENDANLYTCQSSPRHMSVAIDVFEYRLPYQSLMGGVTAMRKEHIEKANGFSNSYFGWGGEDDDLYRRIERAGLKLTRYAIDIARYKMIKHKQEAPNPQRMKLLENAIKRVRNDGINTLKYGVINTTDNTLYSRILVSITRPAGT